MSRYKFYSESLISFPYFFSYYTENTLFPPSKGRGGPLRWRTSLILFFFSYVANYAILSSLPAARACQGTFISRRVFPMIFVLRTNELSFYVCFLASIKVNRRATFLGSEAFSVLYPHLDLVFFFLFF